METKHSNIRKYIGKIEGSLDNKNFARNSLAMLYHENSKFSRFEVMEQGYRIEKLSNNFINKRLSQPYKAYPKTQKISLEEYEKNDFQADLFRTISERRSERNYQNYSISLNEIGKMLYFSYGITGKSKVKKDDYSWHYRAVPSGGALYPLELYLYINNGAVPEGLYHYRPDISSIELMHEEEQMDFIEEHVYVKSTINIAKCSCIMFITSLFNRNYKKYGERSYRFTLQEVGFVSQNTVLTCEALGLSSCMAGGYSDNKINHFLMVDGTLETIQGIIIIGKS